MIVHFLQIGNNVITSSWGGRLCYLLFPLPEAGSFTSLEIFLYECAENLWGNGKNDNILDISSQFDSLTGT